MVFTALSMVFNAGSSGTAGTVKFDNAGIHWKPEGQSNYTTFARDSDATGTVTFPAAGATAVGTTNTQTLTNKALGATGTTFPAIIAPTRQCSAPTSRRRLTARRPALR
jgi:hypothetical protein